MIHKPKHGVQAIVMVEYHYNYLKQKYLLVQDRDDRGNGTGIKKLGLAGGGIEYGETAIQSLCREVNEELALNIHSDLFESFGCYQKLRPGGFINDNHLFVTRLEYKPKKLVTNDPSEVSKIHIKNLEEIVKLAKMDYIHEGSVRLLFNFIKDVRFGSLNDPVHLNGYTF